MIPRIRLFTKDDIAPALDLCRSAGWNQLRDDWSRLINDQPDGCFVADIDRKLVGTVTTTCYGKELAWIGMMLVHPDHRRLGIATALMNAGLSYLRGKGMKCIKLDATPQGQSVYEQLGFQTEWSFHRWQRGSTAPSMAGTRSQPSPIDAHASLDLEAFGVDRKNWLDRLAGDSICENHGGGFGMIRSGHLANYLGPVTAGDVDAAERIIGSLLAHSSGRVFWDVPHPNRDAVELAERLGFDQVRDLTRMWMGVPLSPNIKLQYALSDPGTG